ncbi:MAG TPA: hypothetical protein VIW25_14330 [Nitrososphaeraceae archaeon]|jgi:hypothetical protein
MSKKQSKVDFNDNKELRSLELSTNVNDYDTGEPLTCSNEEPVSKKKIGVNEHMEVKTGDKSRQ